MRILITLFWICAQIIANAQPLTADASTLLLLNFNNSVQGAAGENPIQTQNITYQSGMHGQALYVSNTTRLRYDTLQNLRTPKGTIEFWVRPEVQGTAFHMVPATNGMNIGVGTWTVLDVNLGVPGQTKSVTVPNIFEVNVWYHLAFTWDNESLKLYKNGQLQATTSVGYNLPTVPLPYFNIGSTNAGSGQLVCRLDEFRISNRARTPFEVLQSYLAGINVQINNLSLANTTPVTLYKTWKIYLDNPGWWKTPEVSTVYNGTTYVLPNSALTWTVSDPTKAEVVNGVVKALNYGTTQLIGTYGNLSVSLTLNIMQPVSEPQTLSTIDPLLSNPATCKEKLMPVVIIAYFPTINGVQIDQSEADQWFPQDIALVSNAKTRVQSIAKHTKFSLEEGSKFRGYGNPQARPYLGYEVVDIIYVYEPIPRNRPVPNSNPVRHYLEPYEIIHRFGGQNYVNNEGVKEFWIFAMGMSLVEAPESNMSSPTTGDISNSYRYNDDLPVYDNTYIVYGYNYSRSGNQAIHNHGHQIESMMAHVNQLQDGNTSLFWQKFAGWGPNNSTPPIGRCGDTHHPPNTTQDYDYNNSTLVWSDILNWLPAGGTQTQVNNQTWGSIPYPFPPNLYYNANGVVIDNLHIDVESKWYILWMQSLPGYGQQIPYNGYYLTNWWKIIYDWDDYYNKGLYRAFPDALANPCSPVCGSTFTDSGGAGNNYNNNASEVRIFCPDNPGQNVKVTFTSFNTQAQFDKLYVYNGPDLHYPIISSGNNAGLGNCTLAGGLWGNLNSTLPGPFVSTHESGCLTFRFCSDGSVTESGWTSNISCISCPSSVSTTSDNVPGCLRWAMECANPTDTISFASNLSGATLQVNNTPLPVNKNLSILQTQSTQFNIIGVNTPNVFDIYPTKSLYLKYVNIYSETGTQGRSIKNQGDLTLDNVILFNKTNAIPSSSALWNTATGTVKTIGNVRLQKY